MEGLGSKLVPVPSKKRTLPREPRTASRNSSGTWGVSPMGNAVLVIWPVNDALELAESLARGGSLCVIPGTFDDLGHFAQHLWNPGEVPD